MSFSRATQLRRLNQLHCTHKSTSPRECPKYPGTRRDTPIYGLLRYGFSAFWIINRLSILVILVVNRVRFLYSSPELGMLFRRSYFFIINNKTTGKRPPELMFRATDLAATVIKRTSNFWSGHK